jgi:hypothetical protein
MRGITLLAAFCLTLLLPEAWPGSVARADEQVVTCTKAGDCSNIATKDEQRRRGAAPGSAARTDKRSESTNVDQKLREARKKFTAEHAIYLRRLANFNRCLRTFDPSLSTTGCGNPPTPPTAPEFDSDTFSGRGNQPLRITAGQAAAIAVARLHLPTIAPGIGPSPELNPWKMAAVGYPLWLWADGRTHVGPISDSVAGLSVSLEAEVSSLTFRMGDGHTVNCAGTGRPWTAAVNPGTKSPDCGYSYTEPSLPERPYSVSAITNWAVRWTSNGQSGVINVPAVDTTELPVGELQVLVR